MAGITVVKQYGEEKTASVDETLETIRGNNGKIRAVIVLNSLGNIDVWSRSDRLFDPPPGGGPLQKPGDPIIMPDPTAPKNQVRMSNICCLSGSPGCVTINGVLYCWNQP